MGFDQGFEIRGQSWKFAKQTFKIVCGCSQHKMIYGPGSGYGQCFVKLIFGSQPLDVVKDLSPDNVHCPVYAVGFYMKIS